MNKKQIKRFTKYLVLKTKGQFHYEEDYWKDFVSKSMISKIQRKINICMQNKNYEYYYIYNCYLIVYDINDIFLRFKNNFTFNGHLLPYFNRNQ